MGRLKERFRSHSPVPPVASEDSNAPTHSAESDMLASIIKVLDVAERLLMNFIYKGRKQ